MDRHEFVLLIEHYEGETTNVVLIDMGQLQASTDERDTVFRESVEAALASDEKSLVLDPYDQGLQSLGHQPGWLCWTTPDGLIRLIGNITFWEG